MIYKTVKDRKNGQVYSIIDFLDGAKFEGCYANGKKNGFGTLLFGDGSKYIGEF